MNNINYTSNGLSQFYSDSRFSGITGQRQTIVVIDVGFNLSHTGFGKDTNKDGVRDIFLRQDLDFTTTRNTVNDGDIHGTRVSSVAYSVAKGINIIPIQVSTVGNIANALEWVSYNQARYNITAVNISLSDATNSMADTPGSFSSNYAYFYKSVGMVEKKGISVVSSSGNYYQYYRQNGANQLAGFDNVIGVMSVNSNGLTDGLSLSGFSQRRQDLTSAPGDRIPIFDGNNGQTRGTGTSFAAPFISGSIALLQGVAERYMERRLTPSEVKSLIDLTDTELTGTDRSYEQINVFNAANLIYDIGTGIRPNILNSNLLTDTEYRTEDELTRYTSTLTGSSYFDTLVGKSTVSNSFYGGMGNDLLVGGIGSNTFLYNSISEGRDDIMNFRPGRDKIDISRLLDSFGYQGNAPFRDGIIRAGVSNRNDFVISLDSDGLGGKDPQILATLVDVAVGAKINRNSFIL